MAARHCRRRLAGGAPRISGEGSAARELGMADISAHEGHGPETPRRDFLLLVAGSLGIVGAASAIWPFIDSLEPAADTIAAGAPIDVDLSPIKPGQQIIVLWRGHPVFIA